MDTYRALVAAEIRAEMARRSITQTQLGVSINKPQTTVSRWVKGSTALEVDDLDRVAKALGISVVDLVSRAWEAMADNRCNLPSGAVSASSQVTGLQRVLA